MRRAALLLLVVLASAVLYAYGENSNPPGFYVDESAIAYNALCVAQHGYDEYGVQFPLFFRSFGEWKNPVYIYALAAVFLVSHPSNLIARRFSNALGFGAAVLLAMLAWRLTGRRWIAVATFVTVLITPNLYEVSRLVFEVAALPLALALFFLAVWRGSKSETWNASHVLTMVGSLVLVTFVYSTGRLLGPLLLVGLAFFDTSARRRPLLAIALLYLAFGVAPLVVFSWRNEGALTGRALQLSYLPAYPALEPGVTLAELESHFAGNVLPLGLALKGDVITRHHVQGGGGGVLAGTLILAGIGVLDIFRRRDRWWCFVLYATVASAVPASLTIDRYHSLRLLSYVFCLVLLSVRGMEVAPRRVLILAAALGVAQSVWFFTNYTLHGSERKLEFDAGARRVVAETLARGVRPVYLRGPVYSVHALWYAAQSGVPRSAFVIIGEKDAAPHGALLFEVGDHCSGCEVVSHHGEFWSHLTP